MRPTRPFFHCLLPLCLLAGSLARGEAMLQYFNTSWAEITAKMPELAEAGYNSLWLPPPTKGSGGLSVGYDLWDRFDLGGKDQRGTTRTRYGTEEELLELVRVAHRFNIRIYFDTIMNHNAFDVPGYNESTPIDLYPGFLAAEDFHLRKTEDGFYRKWDNTRDWGSAWQVQNLGLADLLDISQEGPPNANFGKTEGSTFPKYSGVRHPNNPEYYAYHPTLGYVGFNSPHINASVLANNPGFYTEDVNAMLIRSARWLMERTKADGLRLDAVKHVPDYFFGQQSGDKNGSNAGYLGGVQQQFNLSRGFSDWDNHRDSVFDTEIPRDDAMVFGEHLGQPPGYQGYVDAGMRLVDNDLRSALNSKLGNPWDGISGLDQPGAFGFSPGVAVMHAQSHDSDYAARRELQHATYYTRAGLGLIYTDGNFHAETLGESGGAFPRHSNTSFLGQFGDGRVPNLLFIHNQFARGSQRSAYSDPDYIAYERLDYREGHGSLSQQAVLLFMLNDNYSSGLARGVDTSFPKAGGTANDAYLFNYSTYGGGFYSYASNLGSVVVPPGGYFAFSWKNPDPSTAWSRAGGSVITLRENGRVVTNTVQVVRRDGSDGDPGFNPSGGPDPDDTDYAYTVEIPRVTRGTNVSVHVRADGSTENTLVRLDGGMQLNTSFHALGDPRDNPPALSTDTFLGFEQAQFVQRQHREKFAAEVAAGGGNRNVIHSQGAETWQVVIGTNLITTLNGTVNAPSNAFTAQYAYHNPRTSEAPGGVPQFNPAPQSAAGAPVDVWVKVGVLVPADIDSAAVYYTLDDSYPEGAGGFGAGATFVAPMAFVQNLAGGDWWKGTLPAQPSGTRLRYKIGVYNRNSSIGSVYPSSSGNVDLKNTMTTLFRVGGLNLETIQYRPHNDYGALATGLEEGLHVLTARTFINRGSGSPFPGASIYNTFTQTFYYDNETPGGEIKFPGENDSLGGSEYEAVVRTDRTVKQVYFHIDDANPNNDDLVTTRLYGNGTSSNGVGQAWVPATSVTASKAISSAYPLEWRFRYRNIPAGGQPAVIRVRLLELSSSDDFSLSPAQAHLTELARNVTANGPNTRFFFDWPTVDGTRVGEDYRVRVRFETTLGDGFSDTQLRDSFSFSIRPDGESTGVFQPKTEFLLARSVGNGLGEWAFDLPDLYASDRPDRLYELIVTQISASSVLSRTSVKVRAIPTAPKPFVDIIEPEEVDVIGNRKSIEVTGLPSTNHLIRVATDLTASNLWVTVNGSRAPAVFAGVSTGGVNRLFWDFDWTITALGTHTLVAAMDTNGDTNTVEAIDTVEIPVVLVRRVPANPSDLDDDDDGLLDTAETSNPGAPPSANSDTWTQDQVHSEWALGRTQPLGPDSDLDGLSDGLELGFRTPMDPAQTSLAADLDGDGFPNFLADLDPPFYNTLDNYNRVPNTTSQSSGGDRRKRVGGSATNPNSADSDSDGIPDGVEDANRNGWVDGDGAPLPVTFLPWLGRAWPNGRLDAGETWTETDPNNPDSDADGVTDGFEDDDKNGRIFGDANSNRVHEVSELWTESDPLRVDTDGDGLPDGWEARYAFDPLDTGVDSWRTTGANDGLVVNGPAGNPDGDFVVLAGVTNEYTNLMEYQNGTDPRRFNAASAPPSDSITVGAGPVLGTFAGRTYHEEFRDWTLADLLVLDETEGDGANNQGGDIYPAGDGFDSSRDLTAFYVRDGGDIGAGGDGNLYFRVDFADLQAFAEEQAMDLYVVIDTGQSASGERALPDDVDTVTDMRWEAVVAVYDSRNGRVYTDTNPNSNSASTNQELTQFGMQVRDQTHADGFKGAYFNSELDACEFAISRNALTLPEFPNAGWNGLNMADLRFQVFTTKQGTANTPRGAGDIGGRSDIRDSIYDDGIAEDHWKAQENFSSRITTGFGFNGFHDRGKRAKVALVVHGNQAVKPGNVLQNLINNGQGAGYHRVPGIHDVFAEPLNLHLTATLAMGLQWAATDPATTNAWRLGRNANGPLFNQWLGQLAQSNVVHFLGTTFSDHMLPYFPQDFQQDNLGLAASVLESIYGVAPSARVLWLPERLADSATLAGVGALGYTHGLIDQGRHVAKWFGRTSSLLSDAYRINRVENLDCFVINDFASTFLFDDDDGGLSTSLRALVAKRARSGQQDQVLTLLKNWEEFGVNASADAYDRSLRWMANRPWVELVALDDIARGAVDLSSPPDGNGDTWGVVNRGSGLNKPKVSQDWLDHASKEDFNRWYFGASGPGEQGLANTRFAAMPSQPVPQPFGLVSTGGVSRLAWLDAASLTNPGLRPLGRAVLHSSVFQTAFHNQSNNNLEKFSTGDYVYPDNTNETLASFARHAQAQTRHLRLYKRVDDWAAAPPVVAVALQTDADLDGQDEYLLYNGRIFLVFERAGGRLTAAWLRNPDNGAVVQVAGNFVSYSGSETEEEGFPNTNTNGVDQVGAYRTSCLKDWWAVTGANSGTAQYINQIYFAGPAAGGTGWTFTSPDGKVAKTITLDTGTAASVAYQLSGGVTRLYVRNGLSPNLWDLLVSGQTHLAPVSFTNNLLRVRNTLATLPAEVRVALGAGTSYNPTAVDDEPGSGVNFHTVPLRNQAQTQQVELFGSGAFSFSLDLQSVNADSDGDGLPDGFENQFGFLDRDAPADAALDPDGDGASNLHEYIAGTDPSASASKPQVQQVLPAVGGFEVRFPTENGRLYHIWYRDQHLTAPGAWQRATLTPIAGTGAVQAWLDNGTTTSPAPDASSTRLRYYRVEVQLPAE